MKSVNIKIKKLHPLAQIPKQAPEFAGGWDVVVTDIIKESDDFVICKLGFALDIPYGYKLTLVPRSSLTKTKWIIQNSPGLGDSDFRGEYQLRFRALPCGIKFNWKKFKFELKYPKFPYNAGDRIGQIYLEEIINMSFSEVSELATSVRGDGGFGSTNK